MICMNCKFPIKKARLDVYWCPYCETAWLIKKLCTYKSFEEASKVLDEEKTIEPFIGLIPL